MNPKSTIIVLFFLILALVAGGIFFFINQNSNSSKPVAKKEVKVPVEVVEEKSEELASQTPKKVKEDTLTKPFKLNVHLHDFDEDFLCSAGEESVYLCKNKDKTLDLKLALIKLIPNGKFSIHQNGSVIIEGNYIHGFVNGEVTQYSSDGKVKIVENYKSGLLDGVRNVYRLNNEESILRQEQVWKDGLPDGVFVKNDLTGALIRKVKFTNGEFNGEI